MMQVSDCFEVAKPRKADAPDFLVVAKQKILPHDADHFTLRGRLANVPLGGARFGGKAIFREEVFVLAVRSANPPPSEYAMWSLSSMPQIVLR
jgi:hypothetical protein